LIIVTSIAGFFLGHETVLSALVEQSRIVIGKTGTEVVESILQVKPNLSSSFFAGAFGLIAMLFGSTTVFMELKDTLDQIWKVSAKRSGGIWRSVWARLLSLVITLAMTLLIMISILFSALGKVIVKHGGSFIAEHPFLLEGLNFFFLFVLITALFATIYKVLPSTKIQWQDVWIGAAITSVLFTAGKTLIGLYLIYSATVSLFGAAGSLIVLLFWIYYSAQIFLLGAEFTKLYAHYAGSRSANNL
jgi:membrane protein